MPDSNFLFHLFVIEFKYKSVPLYQEMRERNKKTRADQFL